MRIEPPPGPMPEKKEVSLRWALLELAWMCTWAAWMALLAVQMAMNGLVILTLAFLVVPSLFFWYFRHDVHTDYRWILWWRRYRRYAKQGLKQFDEEIAAR